MTPFAQRVAEAMKVRGLSLRELCREAALDPSFFSKVLSGKRSPPSEEAALRRLARLLGLDEAELIVSAGRVPSEWSSLWRDRGLFDRVNALATSTAAAQRPKPVAKPAAPAAPRPELQVSAVVRKPISDELL